jgi:hypothetical protein
MLKASLFGFSALALVAAASGVQAKAPQCRDGKGRAIPCRQAHAPAPAPVAPETGCLSLMLHGILMPCAGG